MSGSATRGSPTLLHSPVRWLPGLLVLLSGCGIAEYEGRMAKAQDRLLRYEKEVRLLDDPVNVPQRQDKDGNSRPIAALFFRPPKGIGATATNGNEPRARLFYTYAQRSGVVNGIAFVELSIGENSQDFAKQVASAFTATGDRTTRKKNVQPPGRNPLTFETTEFTDGQYFYSVNLWNGATKQVAIAYWMAANQRNAQTSQAIDLSLESFAIDGDVSKARAEYDRMKIGGLKPPDHPQ